MRAVFINACHPDTRHVCGLRARAFAEALSTAGHRIVLLTPPLEEAGTGSDPATLASRLDSHDWSEPFRVSGPFQAGSILPALRNGRYPGGMRQLLIALQYLRFGSVYEDWCAATRPLLPVLAETFRPDVVWAVFGNTGCWRMGQELTHLAGCPWVGDVKDPWDRFVPSLFRRRTARRFDDCTHLTALSATHAAMIHRRMSAVASTIVRSGVPDKFLDTPDRLDAGEHGNREILLCGSIYDRDALATVLATLHDWLDERPAQDSASISFAYAGEDVDPVSHATRPLQGRCRVEMLGTLTLDSLHERQGRAALNLHIPYPPVLFHHKVFELFAADRPILCYPGESAETASLAGEVGARLLSCNTPDDIKSAFSRTLDPGASSDGNLDRDALRRFCWDEQAMILESALKGAIG